jgi:hypothetical protein
MLALLGMLVPAILFGITEADRVCRTNAQAPAASSAGWSLWPPGLRCNSPRADGTPQTVVVPWSGFGQTLHADG